MLFQGVDDASGLRSLGSAWHSLSPELDLARDGMLQDASALKSFRPWWVDVVESTWQEANQNNISESFARDEGSWIQVLAR